MSKKRKSPEGEGPETPKSPKSRKPTGRKTILTPEVEKAILDAIALGATDTIAYSAAGVSKAAFYHWIDLGTDQPHRPATETTPAFPGRKARQPYADFVDKLQVARGKCDLSHLANVAHHAQGSVVVHETLGEDGRVIARTTERKADGDWKASKWLLAVRHPEHYSERHVVENRHTNATGTGPVVVSSSLALVRELKGADPAILRTFAGCDTSDLAPETDEGG